MKHALKMNYLCLSSVNNRKEFFKNSTKGVNENRLVNGKVSSLQEKQNLYNGGELWGDGVT
jgi:hypothetical protein